MRCSLVKCSQYITRCWTDMRAHVEKDGWWTYLRSWWFYHNVLAARCVACSQYITECWTGTRAHVEKDGWWTHLRSWWCFKIFCWLDVLHCSLNVHNTSQCLELARGHTSRKMVVEHISEADGGSQCVGGSDKRRTLLIPSLSPAAAMVVLVQPDLWADWSVMTTPPLWFQRLPCTVSFSSP